MTVGEDQTQVAAGPDAESMVEQITYLTSWPAPEEVGPSEVTATPTNMVEVVTTPTNATVHHHHHGGVVVGGAGDPASHAHPPSHHPHHHHGGMVVGVAGDPAGHAPHHGLVGEAGNPVVVEDDHRPYQITFRTIDDYSNQ